MLLVFLWWLHFATLVGSTWSSSSRYGLGDEQGLELCPEKGWWVVKTGVTVPHLPSQPAKPYGFLPLCQQKQ